MLGEWGWYGLASAGAGISVKPITSLNRHDSSRRYVLNKEKLSCGHGSFVAVFCVPILSVFIFSHD